MSTKPLGETARAAAAVVRPAEREVVAAPIAPVVAEPPKVWQANGAQPGERSAAPALSDEDRARFAQAAHDAQKAQSLARELTRQGGLTVRAGVNGSVGLLNRTFDATVGNLVNGAVNLVNSVAGTSIPNLPSTAASLAQTLDAHLPAPQNATERVVQRMAESMVGAAGVSQVASVVASHATSAVTQAVATQLAANQGLSLSSAATSAGASAVTAEAGGGQAAQLLAGVLGALVPAGAVALKPGPATAAPASRPVAAAPATAPTLKDLMTPRLAAATKQLKTAAEGLDEVRKRLTMLQRSNSPDRAKLADLKMTEAAWVEKTREAVAAFQKELVDADPSFRALSGLPEWKTAADEYLKGSLAKALSLSSKDLEVGAAAVSAPVAAAPFKAPAPPPLASVPAELSSLAKRASDAYHALGPNPTREGYEAAQALNASLRDAVLAHAKATGHPEVLTVLRSIATYQKSIALAPLRHVTPRAVEGLKETLGHAQRDLEALLTQLAQSIPR